MLRRMNDRNPLVRDVECRSQGSQDQTLDHMTKQTTEYVVCVRNDDYAASLELRKIYQVLPDHDANSHGLIRVIDESGEDYLYPQDFFMPLEVPEAVCHAFAEAC